MALLQAQLLIWPGLVSLTAKEARIVHQVKQSGKERVSKHRKRIADATYRHSSIVLALKSQIDTLK